MNSSNSERQRRDWRIVCLMRLIVETPNRIEGQGEYDCLLQIFIAVLP